MKLKIYILISLAVWMTASLQAQVSIGGGTAPAKGMLLQLKDTEPVDASVNNVTARKGGLLLPRVKLTKSDALKPFIPSATPDEVLSHVGLMVYNINDQTSLCPGVFVWRGDKWSELKTKGDAPAPLTFDDNEGNTYTYQKYGTKDWMTQNVRTLYKKGIPSNGFIDNVNGMRINPAYTTATSMGAIAVKTSIPVGNITYKEQTDDTSSARTLTLTNDGFATKFGLLYTWDQAQNACPDGWHLPNDADWDALAISLGGVKNGTDFPLVGANLKANNTTYTTADATPVSYLWNGYSTCTTKNVGFNALPSGIVQSNGTDTSGFAIGAFWWSASAKNTYRIVRTSDSNFDASTSNSQDYYVSVRCVKD